MSREGKQTMSDFTTTGLRRLIRAEVASALPPGLPLFDDSDAVRGPALEKGYLRLALTLDEEADGLGAGSPRSGRLSLSVAVPSGRGSAATDAIIDSLNTGLSYGGGGGVRFGGLALTPGRQIGQLWVSDAEIGFAAWPAGDGPKTDGPTTEGPA